MRVLVLGAGYAGVALARRLERGLPDETELVVIDDTGSHLVQHELHRVVRRPALADDIVVPLRDVFDRATVRTATVTAVDPHTNEVTLGDETVTYDVCAVCLGAQTDFYGLPGVEAHAIPLKRIEHAKAIRRQFVSLAENGGTACVGGAGLSGVQLAGELAVLARENDVDDVVNVVLVERESTVAPTFSSAFQSAIRDRLNEQGVDIRTATPVARATADTVVLEDESTVAADLFVWTGGIRGPDALGGDRAAVRSDLRVGDRTFVVGDAADVVDAEGQRVPASAQAAVREAKTVADSITRIVGEEGGVFDPRPAPFVFDSPGWLVSVGDDAVAQVGPSVFTGPAAHALKATVGAGYLRSVGAIRNAAELVSEEFGGGRS